MVNPLVLVGWGWVVFILYLYYIYSMKINFVFVPICLFLLVSCNITPPPIEEKFTVSLDSLQKPISVIEGQYETALAIKKNNINVIFFPEDDIVALQYKVDLVTYYQFWNRYGRDTFISSLEKYNKEYDERTISSNGKKTLKNYGRINGYLIWRMSTFTVQAKANVNIDIGYIFYRKLPYFTITQRETTYVNPNDKNNTATSKQKTIYFTRAQAADLAEIFDQAFLDKIGF